MCVRFGRDPCNADPAWRTGQKTRAALDRLFEASSYKPVFQPGMDAWYQCHLRGSSRQLCLYALDCDLTKATLPIAPSVPGRSPGRVFMVQAKASHLTHRR